MGRSLLSFHGDVAGGLVPEREKRPVVIMMARGCGKVILTGIIHIDYCCQIYNDGLHLSDYMQ